MKRTIAILLVVISLLTGCNAGYEVNSTQIFDYNDKFVYNNGEFYTDGSGRLHYFDFKSMKGALVCAKPNCFHNDSDCSAIGMNNHAVAMDKNLYFFESETYWNDDGILAERTHVYKANIDGTSRVKIGTIDDISLISMQYALFKEGVLYFGGVKNSFTETESGRYEIFLFGYDLKINSLNVEISLGEYYEPDVSFAGEYGEEIYFTLSYNTEKTEPFSLPPLSDNPTDEELAEYAKNIPHIDSERRIMKYSLESGELSYCKLPDVNWKTPEKGIWLQAKGGYLIFTDCTDSYAVSETGSGVLIENLNGADEAVVNGYIFPSLLAGKNTAYRLSDGAKVTVSVEDSAVRGGYVVGFYDGKYILRYSDVKRQETVYSTAQLVEGE